MKPATFLEQWGFYVCEEQKRCTAVDCSSVAKQNKEKVTHSIWNQPETFCAPANQPRAFSCVGNAAAAANVIRIITETGLRIYKELTPMRKHQVDLLNAIVWIPDSKTPNGIAEVSLTPVPIEAFKSQMAVSGDGPFLFPSDRNSTGHLTKLKTAWRKTLRRAKVPYFRIYDLRSTYATRLSAGGVADEWVTQMLRQSDAHVFKKYPQMKLQMKREALGKLNRRANEVAPMTPEALMGAPVCTMTRP